MSRKTTSDPFAAFLENAFLYGLATEIKLQDLYGGESPKPNDDVIGTLLGELADVDARIAVVKQRIQTDANIAAFLDVLAELETRRNGLTERLEQERTRQVQIGKEGDVLNDLQALARMWAGEHPDRSDLRTRIKGKVRQLIQEVCMVVYGRKRSKFKSAQVQIFFKAGGSKMMVVHAITNEFQSAEMIEHSGTGKAVMPEYDFRLLRDPVAGVEVQKYVAFMEKVNEHHAGLVSK